MSLDDFAKYGNIRSDLAGVPPLRPDVNTADSTALVRSHAKEYRLDVQSLIRRYGCIVEVAFLHLKGTNRDH
jgi:hypothetical protein